MSNRHSNNLHDEIKLQNEYVLAKYYRLLASEDPILNPCYDGNVYTYASI